MNIPDHPEIARCLATGYPNQQKPCIRCCDCEKPLIDEEVFDWDGDSVCEECLKDRIEENFQITAIADALGIRHAMATE